MPTYRYRCTAGHEFDEFQKFSDNPLAVCTTCDEPVRRVIQPVGVVFKGTGWYINDSRKGAKSETNSSETTSTAVTEAKSDSTSDPGVEKSTEKKLDSKESKVAKEAKPASVVASA